MRNKNVPEVRFPRFSDAWEQRKLGDISDVTKLAGFEFTKYMIYADKGKIIALRGLNVKNGKLVLDDVKYIDQSDFSKLNRSKLFKDDILFTYVGTVGELAVVPENDKYYLAPNVARIRLNDSVDPQFVSQMMGNKMFYDKVIFPLIATSSQPALSMENVRKFVLKLPSIEEQEKIGTFFKQFDNLITLHQRELTTLLQTKQGFLQKLFPKEGEFVPEVRLPGFAGHWKQCRLSELADFLKGNGYSKADLTEKGIPIILYGRLYTKYETVIKVVDSFTSIEKEKSIVSKGKEVIVPSSGETSEDISRASVVNDPGIILGGDLNIIRPTNEIDSVFLALSISNGEQRKELIRRAQGKSVVHLHNSDLKEVNLLFPCKEEQIKIGKFFKQLDETIALQEKKLEALQQTKKAFLQKMFV